MRSLKDAQLIVTKALPAAAANHNTGTIDLESVAGWPTTEKVAVLLSLPALPALVEAKTVTVKLQDSADNSSFTDIAELSSWVITGGTGGGAAAATRTVFLPPSARRYLQANIAVLTAGGDNTAVSLTVALLF